jgi:hypothetical protein
MSEVNLPYHIISIIGNFMDRKNQSIIAQLNKFFANEFSQNRIGLSVPRRNAFMIRRYVNNIAKGGFIHTLMLKNDFKQSIELLIGVTEKKIVFILTAENRSELPTVIGVYRLGFEETFNNASEHMFECIKKNKRNKLNKIISNMTNVSLLPSY